MKIDAIRSLQQLHLLLYRLQVELVQHSLLLNMLFHRQIDLPHQLLLLRSLLVQVLDVVLNVLEILGIHDVGPCHLLQVLGTNLPNVLQLGLHLALTPKQLQATAAPARSDLLLVVDFLAQGIVFFLNVLLSLYEILLSF